MKKYFLTGSLAACAFSVLIPNQAFAANLNLYGAGSLRNALTEVSQDSTDISYPVTMVYGNLDPIKRK